MTRKRLKRRFWAGMPGIKGCTVQSFKGWEARAVVAVSHSSRAHQTLYVAMTRVKGDSHQRPAYLSVINAVEGLNVFQSRFEREITPAEAPALAGQQVLGV